MKKLIIGVLVALCAVCLSVAVACNKKDEEPKYYTLTFQKADGITYDCEIPNGYEVREGETVTFGVTKADNVVGEPVVSANDSKLNADDGGKYSFKITSDTTVSVSGTFVLNSYQVTFKKGDPDGDDYRLTYHCDDGDVNEGFYVSAGEQVSFTVDMSVYYDISNMKVLANTMVLKPDSNGVYTFTVNGKTNISITDVTLAQWFGEKENGGDGTRENPYIISEPIDLYELAAMVKNNWYYRYYYSAYYKMVKDIDLKGEQLFIIGDSENYPFAGHFDGGGHTISNFYITDTLIDQETFVPYHTPYVGMFGCVSATAQDDGLAEIYNLKLDEYNIEINAAESGSSFFAGSIVGWGFGVGITGCEVTNGTIIADADTNYFGYIGGIIGSQYSAYQDESVNYNSIVNACSSSVEIIGASGYVFGAGGIAGVVNSSDIRATAAVINSYSTGSVSGAIYSGGVVGRLSSYSSVQGCYSTGFVEARNSISLTSGLEQYAYAYAGGIAGYVDSDGIIADCFSVSGTHATAAADVLGTYSFTDDIACGYAMEKDGNAHYSVTIEANPAVVLNSYSEKDNINKELILNRLGWHEEDWTFVKDVEFPVINKSADGRKQFTLKINLGSEKYNNSSEISVNIDSVYMPVTSWYTLTDGIDSYGYVNADSRNRSYGFYFDAEFKNRVPYGYIPINSVTLYAGFADYGYVAGEYYFSDTNGSYISLGEDGSLKYVDGALNHSSYYTYDGETLTLFDTFIGIALDGTDTYQSFKATLSNGVLTVFDNETHAQGNEISAFKAVSTLNYGSYYSADGSVYTFNKNGTGSAVTASNTVNFTYEITGSGLTVSEGTQKFNCQVDANGNVTAYNGVAVTPLDKFAGVWEKSAGSKKQYTFDGKGYGSGTYTVTSFGYDKDGNKVNVTTQSGTYTVNSDGEMEFDGFKIGIDQDGFITINGETYYKENSFAGVWNFFNNTDPVELTLNGIGAGGVGTGVVDYGDYGSFDVTYATVTDANGASSITLYYNDMPLGLLSYNAGANTLTGRLYLARLGNITEDATFFLYDDFKGSWVSEVIELVEFNGLGNYDVKGNANHMAVIGSIKVNGEAAGTYTLVNSTLTGSFVYGGVTYNIAYVNGRIEVSYAGGSFDFIKHDNMYGLELQDGSGLVYSFDGRGNLASGGTLTVSNGSTYKYKNVVGGIDVYNAAGANKVGSILIGTDYVLNLGAGDKILTVVNGFTGEWLIAGTDGRLVVNTINAQMKAQGSAFGESVEFTYHKDGNYLTYSESGQTYYINIMQAGGVSELIVSMQNGAAGEYSVCVSPESLDGYQGTYTANGTGNYLKLDGLGKGKYVKGTVEQYKDGELDAVYAYTIGSFGIELSVGTTKYLLVECLADDNGAYGKDGAYRRIVACDALYGYTAYLVTLNEDGKLEVNKGVSFLFNGIGTLTCSDGKVYTYKIDSRDRANMEFNLSLVSASGDKLKAVVSYGGENITLEMGECDAAPVEVFTDKDGVKYSFDGMSNLSVGGTFYVTSGETTTLLTYRVEGGKIKIYNSNNTDYGEFVNDGGCKIILANGNEILLTAAE